MKIRFSHIAPFICVAMVLVMMSCSASKNTAKSRFWQSFTARYNTYYNGTLAYIDGSLEKEKGNKDNYTELIPLYTVGNKNSREIGKGNYDRAIEKCEKTIKLHSIKKRPEWTKNRRKTERDIEWLSRREYNPMMWKAWMLMGRSQFYKGDFDAAASTFNYMSRLYQTQPAIYGKARAWLAKCHVEQNWLYDAEDVIRNMSRDSIHWSAQKEWDYTYADYYIHTGEYDKAIPYLQKVVKHEQRKYQKARELFLLGQLQAHQGMKQDAYKSFKRVVRQSPPYELAFNARIAMTEVMADGQAKKMIRKLKRMAASDNNKDFLDQVYYAIGNIYMMQKDTLHAISAYETGNEKATRNGTEKGVLLLRLGDIYWDIEKYSDAQRCYTAAIGLLDKDRNDYKQLSDRSKVLDQLVPFTDAVYLQDSLQLLAKMDEKDRNAAIDRVIEALKKKEKEERDKQAEEEAKQTMQKNGGNQNTVNNAPQQNNTNEKGLWYFYNPMAVNQGKQAFQKQWGKRDNTDNWQRINQTVVASPEDKEEALANMTEEQRDSIAAEELAAEEEVAEDTVNLADDPHNREYYLAQIPFTEEQVEASNLIIMDGLYNSGVIFKDKLDNLALSDKQFTRLLQQYPTYDGMANAYYHMFLLYSRMGEESKAATFVDSLSTNYPDNDWTLLLTDPYFRENAQFGVHIEDSLYANTYNAFKADSISQVMANCEISKTRFPLGANRDKFIFIGGLSKLNDGDPDGCVEEMQTMVSKFPQSKLSAMAGMILNGVKQGRRLHGGRFDIGDVWARRSVVLADSDSIAARTFSDDPNLEYVFMVAYQPDSVDENQLLFEMARYNFTSYMVRNFDIELDEDNGLYRMLVTGFQNFDEANEYAHRLLQQENIKRRMGRSRRIIISKQNMELLGRQFSYDDYDAFYQEHFAKINQETLDLLTMPADMQIESLDGSTLPVMDNIEQIISPAPVQPTDSIGNGNDKLEMNAVPTATKQDGQPADNEDEYFPIDDDAEKAPANNGDIIVIPEERPARRVQQDDNTFPIEEEKAPVRRNNNDGDIIVIPEDKPARKAQQDDNTFPIEEEKAPTKKKNDDEEIIIIPDEAPASKAGSTSPQPAVPGKKADKQAEKKGTTPTAGAKTTQQKQEKDDEIIILPDDEEEQDNGEDDESFELEGF